MIHSGHDNLFLAKHSFLDFVRVYHIYSSITQLIPIHIYNIGFDIINTVLKAK